MQYLVPGPCDRKRARKSLLSHCPTVPDSPTSWTAPSTLTGRDSRNRTSGCPPACAPFTAPAPYASPAPFAFYDPVTFGAPAPFAAPAFLLLLFPIMLLILLLLLVFLILFILLLLLFLLFLFLILLLLLWLFLFLLMLLLLLLFNRLGVAGAVLQTPSDYLICSITLFLQIFKRSLHPNCKN